MEFNQKIRLAELVGIILGDGNLHKKSNCITIVGSLEDRHYYKKHVVPLFKELFGIEPKLRKRNDRNAYYLQLENKEVFEFLTEDVGLIRGNKINARVPSFILNNKKRMFPFLRGLFDTDGCLKFSRQAKNNNYYPRVRLALKKSKFTSEVEEILIKLGFEYSKWEDKRGNVITFYEISGKENLEKWFNTINPSNPIHISKFLFWKKFGYYTPKSSLDNRLRALNLNIDDISQ